MTKDKIENPQDKAFHDSATDNEFWTIEYLIDELPFSLLDLADGEDQC